MLKIFSWFKYKDRIIYLEYTVLVLIVLLPILIKSGYVLTMDMIFTPDLKPPAPFNIPDTVLYFINFFLPSQIIQKILLFLTLFLSGIGIHKLIPTKEEYPKYFAGIFYIFNPFVYSRFLFGHLWLLIPYALMPFVIKTIFIFFNKPNLKNSLKLSLWFAFIGCISHHFIVFLFLFFGVSFLVFICKKHNGWKEISIIIKYTFLTCLMFFILSSWWIISYFDSNSTHGHFIQQTINQNDFNVFQTVSDENYGILWNVAALYGFWGDRMGQYVVPKDIMPYWFILFLIIFALVIWGAVKLFQKDKSLFLIFSSIAIISFVFSVGTAHSLFAPAINFLNDKIFILKGFRDPQKFSALLVLAYAYFVAFGLDGLFKIPKLKQIKTILFFFFIIVIFLYSPLMAWGFKGQLYVSQYPKTWFEVNQILNQDKEEFNVLFFPWHLYMSFEFAKNKVIANPAAKFFDKPTIAGDNMELGNIYTQSQRPVSQMVEKEILANKQDLQDLNQKLKTFNIKYIILTKEVDWQEYQFLDKQDDLKIIYDAEDVRVYKNKNADE